MPRDARPEPPETDAECRARHRAMLREMAELGMRAARVATERLEQPETGQAEPASSVALASLTLARAMHAVRQAIALEQRILAAALEPARAPAAGAPRPAAVADPRRAKLRDALRGAATRAEPDRAARNQMFRFIDERLDVELLDDPDQDIPMGDILVAISEELGLALDLSRLPDELLGIPPHRRVDPLSQPP